MGYRAYSHAMYGITVNRQNLEKTEKVRACRHQTDESKNFCLECGKPVWVKETYSALDMLDRGETGRLSYFTESGDYSENPNYDFMIGFELAATDYNRDRAVMAQPTEEMKQEILDFIKNNKLNLTEKDIKVIVYTYHSY